MNLDWIDIAAEHARNGDLDLAYRVAFAELDNGTDLPDWRDRLSKAIGAMEEKNCPWKLRVGMIRITSSIIYDDPVWIEALRLLDEQLAREGESVNDVLRGLPGYPGHIPRSKPASTAFRGSASPDSLDAV